MVFPFSAEVLDDSDDFCSIWGFLASDGAGSNAGRFLIRLDEMVDAAFDEPKIQRKDKNIIDSLVMDICIQWIRYI